MKQLSFFLLIILACGVVSCKKSGVVQETPEEQSKASTTELLKEEVEATAEDRGYIVKVGDQAPDFVIEYLDGRATKLSDLKGKLVMIQFTASWCGVCRKEMPFIEKEIWSKHKDNPHFVLIGIDLKEDRETTAKFAETMKVTYPLTLDADGSRFALYTAPKAGVTRNILVGKDGKIIMLTRLFEMEEFNAMVSFIDDYLSEN